MTEAFFKNTHIFLIELINLSFPLFSNLLSFKIMEHNKAVFLLNNSWLDFFCKQKRLNFYILN